SPQHQRKHIEPLLSRLHQCNALNPVQEFIRRSRGVTVRGKIPSRNCKSEKRANDDAEARLRKNPKTLGWHSRMDSLVVERLAAANLAAKTKRIEHFHRCAFAPAMIPSLVARS